MARSERFRKSTIADALASLTYGEAEGLRKFPQRRDAPPGCIELFEDGSEHPVARWRTLEGHSRSDDHIRLLVEEKLFGVDSRYSAKYEAQQGELDRLRRKVERGTATEEDHQRIFELSEVFENLMAGEEERRADGGFISQISKLNRALVQDLAAELEKAKKG